MDRRYQAHPIAKDEAYELRPDSPRRDAIMAGLGIVALVACYLVASIR
jgi:hypothetical protein